MPDGSRSETRAWWRQWIGPLIAVVVICLVGVLGYRVASQYEWVEIEQAIGALSWQRIARGAIFAAASYFCLTWSDWLALRCISRPLAWRQAALASFCSLSIGHNVGFAGLSSGAVRYRFYSRWGLGFEDVAKLVIYCGITVAMGLVTVAGLSLLLNPGLVAGLVGAQLVVRTIGVALLTLPVTYIGLTRFRRSISLFGRTVRLPSVWLAAGQVVVGTVNYLCVAACLHQLLGGAATIGYPDVAAAYVLAHTGMIASHVPGGLGVLESIVLSLLPGASVLAALLMFRVVYFLAPMAFGLALLGLSEVVLKPRQEWSARATAKPSLQKP